MTKLLIRWFVKDSDNLSNLFVREAYGKLAGIVGIASNLLLFALKLLIGLWAGSIAIMADAINNLSDCAASIITLVGFRLAAMPPDEEHPYGHARFEYISGLIVSFLIIAIGLEFLVSSVRKILQPEPVLFSATLAVVLLLSIALKWWQGRFNRTIGNRIESEALSATATDSINDAISTSAVLLGAVIGHIFGLHIDGWLGLLVAIFIIISGIQLVIETLNPLLGIAPDDTLVEQIKERILGYESVIGLHDLILHNYGPGRRFASVHVEVPASQDILVSHDIIDRIERDFLVDLGIALVIHLDPLVTDDKTLDSFQKTVKQVITEIDPVLSMHDFRMVEGKTHTNLIFDVRLPPRYSMTDSALRKLVEKKVNERTSDTVYCVITVDRSYTATTTKLKHR